MNALHGLTHSAVRDRPEWVTLLLTERIMSRTAPPRGPSRRWWWRSTTSRQAPRASAAARTVAALVVALNLWLAAINWRAHAVRRGDGGGGGHGAVRSFFVCGTFWVIFFRC